MTLLSAIWLASLVLALLSVFVMGTLVLRRIINDRKARRAERRRTELSASIFEAMDRRDGLAGVNLTTTDLDMVGEIVVGLLNAVAGDARDRLIDVLRGTEFEARCRKKLKSPVQGQRLKAITNLAIFANPDLKDDLFEALSDPSPQVRLAAAHALLDLGTPLSVADIIERLGIGVVINSRNLRALFEKLARRDTGTVLDLLKSTASEDIILLAIFSLGRAQDYQVLPELINLFDSPNIEVRTEILRALANLGHPAALPVIQKGLGDPVWQVRTQAAIGAGRIGLKEAIPDLAERLHDGEWWVRYRAASALKKLGADGVSVLEEVSATPSAAAAAVQLVLSEGSEA